MSDKIDRLETRFGVPESPSNGHVAPVVYGSVTDEYEHKMRHLGRKWHDILAGAGGHEYESASEADMAVIDRMVKCNFTTAEIWLTIRSSARYQDRKQRKGERHTEQLYEMEIGKAFADVIPFPPDPKPAQIVRSQTNTSAKEPSREPRAVKAPPVTQNNPYSFIEKYIRYGESRTDSPPEAHELMAVTVLSALAGPGPRIPIATSVDGWSLVIWGMYVVNSTVGRKSTTVNLSKDIIERVLGSSAIFEWEGSPQGMLQRLQLRDGQTSVFVRDEYSGLVQQINRGGHMAGLSQMLIRAYDGGVLENIRTRKKNREGKEEEDTDRVENPYLVTLSASTFDSLIHRATIDNVLDGFLTRFVFVTGAADPRPLGRLTREMMDARYDLIEHAHRFTHRAHATGMIEVDDETLDAAWELEQCWLTGVEDTSRPDATAAAMKRLSEAVFKVAGLIAIDESEHDVVITREFFDRARIMGERWRDCTLALIEALGSTEFTRNLDAVNDTIQRRTDGISISDLSRTHRKLRKRDFEEILDTLSDRELIESRFMVNTSGKGRPKKVLFPFGRAPEPEAE